ncbi:MAG: MaoC/PaaZ C-terminal domain-containing protein, partial [Proteobacteria bacterium]|nr:MaoC/PaaZ C-terminal domain-containing protein [Pseudomonadota bacterium]
EPRWLMSYAAGLNDFSDAYMDTTAGVSAHPLFPVCVEWPVILDLRHVEGSDAMTPQESVRGVHASHDLHIHRPIHQADTLFTVATIIGIESRKPGAYQTIRLDTTDENGDLVAQTYQGSLSRGVAVQGGDRIDEPLPDLPVAAADQIVPEQHNIPIAAGAAHVYTECARIFNPIHTDRAVAIGAGLPDIILHGTATLALSVSKIVDEYTQGPQQISRVACRFSGMVFMPSTLTIMIRARSQNGVWFDVRTDDGNSAISGGFIGLR